MSKVKVLISSLNDKEVKDFLFEHNGAITVTQDGSYMHYLVTVGEYKQSFRVETEYGYKWARLSFDRQLRIACASLLWAMENDG